MSEHTLHEEAAAALSRITEKHRELSKELKRVRAFAVFPSMGRASAVLGASFGRGAVYDRSHPIERGRPLGFARLTQLTIGVQVGGQTFTELVLFEDDNAFKEFQEGRYAFNANASAVVVKAAASGTNNAQGMTAHAYSQGGMLLEASIGGQKISYLTPDEFKEMMAKKEKKKDHRGEVEAGEEAHAGEGGEEGRGSRWAGGRAREVVSRHPVATAVLGPGLSFATAMLARRLVAEVGLAAEEQ